MLTIPFTENVIKSTLKMSCFIKFDGKMFQNIKSYMNIRFTRILLGVNFDHTDKYEIGYNEKNKCFGVMIRYFKNDKLRWSWMNTLNTHYSGFFLIFEWMNKNLGTNFEYSSFRSTNIEKTLNLFFTLLEEHKQTILTPGSDIFRDLFFSTQFTWTNGLVSNIDSSKYVNQYYPFVKGSLSYERGETDDFKGKDYEVYDENGVKLNCQHKYTDIFQDGEFYISLGLDYNEKNYRGDKHEDLKINLITIDYNGYVYIFKNDKNQKLIGKGSEHFFAHESLLLHKIEKNMVDIAPIIMDITTRCCLDLKMALIIEKEENETVNSYVLENKLLKININNDADPNLSEMLKEILYKL